jgi:hypothetical protein
MRDAELFRDYLETGPICLAIMAMLQLANKIVNAQRPSGVRTPAQLSRTCS